MAWYTTDHARRDAARQGACITNAKTAAHSVVRPHTAETVQIDVVRYRDADGNPTDVPAKTPALGKGDLGFTDLFTSHPQFAHVWHGRLTAKSTGEITRARRFIETAEQCDGYMPVSLIYYSAHTGRYGGGEKLNLQNLGRKSQLRRSLCVDSWEIEV